MKKYDVTAYNENGSEIYDCDIIEADSKTEALSVADDMLTEAGFTWEERQALELKIREMED